MNIKRKITKQVVINGLPIGGGQRITIQSMTNTHTQDVIATLQQIERLHQVGCDIVRVAIFDKADCDSMRALVSASPLPLVADIHYNANFAISCIEQGVCKIRINPGNMSTTMLDRVIDCALMHGTTIRIGVNSGSIDRQLLTKYNGDKSGALIDSLTRYCHYFEDRGLDSIVLSAKSSSVADTIKINELISKQLDYPLHIGLTEAGLPQVGIVKNTLAISTLLSNGIGDTIRVSLTDDPVNEVLVGKSILQQLGYTNAVDFVSCPMCGRCRIDLQSVAKQVYDYVSRLDVPIKVAVMGCEVNGPGECADADIGLAGGTQISFFRKGVIYKKVAKEEAVNLFIQEIDQLVDDIRRNQCHNQ
ncbi:MAG: flavodoxin-dependent (E)-4-hydroxy-3-methylbut-2-enyl-diphosphate synthase [Clostridia bacterium]|nr:flavodoxin-dependent (E)-4-hydroxy-3-methylbut-2-enyl-diphosphate synthase [Clostridia bacterium]